VARTVWVPLLLECRAAVHAVVDPSLAAREAAQALLPQARVQADWDEAALCGCDAAWICSPNALHTAQALRAMREGLNVVVEKPVCFSLDEAQALIDCAAQTGRRLRATAASSHRGDVARLKELVEDGTLGPVICIDVSWRRRSGIPRPGSWFTQRMSAIGGSGADLGWHLLEVALGLLDYPHVTSGLWHHSGLLLADPSAAAGWRGDATSKAHVAIDVDTQTFGCLRTASGVLVRLSTAWCSHQELDETSVTVFGERAEASLACTFGFSDNRRGGSRLELRRHGEVSVVAMPDEPKDAPYRAFVHALVLDFDRSRSAGDEREAAEHRKLGSLSSAMQTLYPGCGAGPSSIEPCDRFQAHREADSKENNQESSRD